MYNFNIGLLGHVDSGKTTLAKALSTVPSTASFDKNPQSQQRGITLDLGFSSAEITVPEHIKLRNPDVNSIQLTFVDCPGHASLIRTIIGGAQIVDLIILVIDAQRGIQTQTAECIVIAEMLNRKLIVAINKIDLIIENAKPQLEKLDSKLRKTFAKTIFGDNVPIVHISAQNCSNIQDLLSTIQKEVFVPVRNLEQPLLIYVDHCFCIKGHGTICTGTIIQGKISVGDSVEIPQIKEQRKVKTIQVFRKPVEKAIMGDRVGICVNQFNSKLMERGLIAQPNYLKLCFAVCLRVNQIAYYKFPMRHKDKFHITLGHETVMGSVLFFYRADNQETMMFDFNEEYEFLDEIKKENTEVLKNIFVLIEFEKPILAPPSATLIASKLDIDPQSNCCRLAFWGNIQWSTYTSEFQSKELPKLKIFKRKVKQGTIQRLVTNEEIIVQDLFKKETDPNIFLGKFVHLSTGERGLIESKFGKAKIKVRLVNGLNEDTLEKLKNSKLSDINVILNYKKYLFNKDKELIQ